MHVPASPRIIQHECLHVYQEAIYDVLRTEYQGRLSPWSMIQAELEVNFVNDRTYYIFWMSIVSLLGCALVLAMFGTLRLLVVFFVGL